MPDPTPEPEGSSGVSQADASQGHAAEATRGGRRPTKEELDARNAAKSRPRRAMGPPLEVVEVTRGGDSSPTVPPTEPED
jgi:hypothetical protein